MVAFAFATKFSSLPEVSRGGKRENFCFPFAGDESYFSRPRERGGSVKFYLPRL